LESTKSTCCICIYLFSLDISALIIGIDICFSYIGVVFSRKLVKV